MLTFWTIILMSQLTFQRWVKVINSLLVIRFDHSVKKLNLAYEVGALVLPKVVHRLEMSIAGSFCLHGKCC